MKNVAIILAAGTGERAGLSRPKQLTRLGGRPVIAHTIERFQTHSDIHEIAIVTNEVCVPEIETIIAREGATKVRKILIGGRHRHDSSLAGIRAYDDGDATYLRLIFHDAVRPLVSAKIISDVVAALDEVRAVDVAIPCTDTIISVNPFSGTIQSIPRRSELRSGQTPQGFHFSVIKDAYDLALKDSNLDVTDDCGIVLKYLPEEPIYVVPGENSNIKLTYADDIPIIDKYMQASAGRRISAPTDPLSLAKLKGKTIVVFGGTSGIGESIVRIGASLGARMHIAARSTGTDIRSAKSVQVFLDRVAQETGCIDAVINAAAVLDRRPLASMDAQEIEQSIGTNFIGAALVARFSYKYLATSRGHLLLFGSSSYTYGRAFYSIYSASKAALINMTQALADEWAEVGIRVNCINPERTRTPMRTRAFGNEASDSLLDPDVVARKSLAVLQAAVSGYVFDINRR